MPSSIRTPRPHPAAKLWLRPTLKDVAQQAGGIIVEPAWGHENDELYKTMIEQGMPFVALDPPLPISAAQVHVDRQAGAYLQVKHLLEIGRRHFLLMIESCEHPFGQAKA